MRDPQTLKILEYEECRVIVEKKLRLESHPQSNKFELIDYEVVPLSATSGYMGQYFKLTAVVAEGDETTSRTIEFFVKLPPNESSPQYEFSQEMGSFLKEVLLYTTVFPVLLGSCSRGCVPECFLGLGEDRNAIIVLEDMAPSGFHMTDKHVPFDFEHCAVLMRTIARFHAESIVFEELGRRSLRDCFPNCFRETLWPLNGNRGDAMFRAAVKGSIALVDMVDELSEEQRAKLKDKIVEMSANHARKLLPSTKYRNVLYHGDLWANNLLFKYDAAGKPVACCLVDFQLARYNPPAHDVICFLQFTTTRKLRSSRLRDLLSVYHESLASALRDSKHGNAKAVYPWRELEISVEELRPFYMLHGILNLPIMMLDEPTVAKYFIDQPQLLERAIYVDRTPLVCAQYAEVPSYRERIKDALLEFHDWVREQA